MAIKDYKISSFSKPVSALSDRPQMSAAELKEWFDSNSANEIKNSINGLIDELETEFGDTAKKEELHFHSNKDVLDQITSVPVTHEELSAVETNAYDYAVDLNDATNRRFSEYATKEEAQEMSDATYQVLNDSKIGEAPADGKIYGRKNKTWVEIIAQSGGSLPTISYDKIDTFFDNFAIVVEYKRDYIHENYVNSIKNVHLLVCNLSAELEGSDEEGWSGASYTTYIQTLYCHDGSIKTRSLYDDGLSDWSEWEVVSATTQYVDSKIGDIDSALDGLHAYAQTLVNGGAL